MTPNEILWSLTALCLGVVLGVRVAVWWFANDRLQQAQIEDALASEEPVVEAELPYKPPAGIERPPVLPAGQTWPGLSDQLGKYPT